MKSPAIINALQKRFGSADFDNWFIQRWHWYDYVRYPSAGTTELNLFSNALGSTDPTSSLSKTLEQTNMPKQGSFGQTFFLIQQIRTHAHILPKSRQPSGISDNANLMFGPAGYTAMMSKYAELLRRGVLLISIQQKDYFDIERPFMQLPPGFGVEVHNMAAKLTTSPPAKSVSWVQQSHQARDVFNLAPNPQMIEPEQAFSVKITWDTTSPVFTTLVNSATPAIDLGVLFDGYIIRPSA